MLILNMLILESQKTCEKKTQHLNVKTMREEDETRQGKMVINLDWVKTSDLRLEW